MGDVRCAEVVDQVPEEVTVLSQLVQVSLLHAPVVHINLQVGFDQVSQLHRVEQWHNFSGTVWVGSDADLE